MGREAAGRRRARTATGARWKGALALSLVVFAGIAMAQTAKEVRELLEWGDNDMALESAEKGLELTPNDAELKFYHALALARTGETDDALDEFKALAKAYPDRPEIHNNIAVLHAREGNYEAARKALEAALATSNAYRTAHDNLGDIYSAQAAEAYNRALARDEQREPPKPDLSLLTSWGEKPPLAQAQTPAEKQPEKTSAKTVEPAKAAKLETQPVEAKPAPVEKPVEKPEVKAEEGSNLAKLVAEAEAAGAKVSYRDNPEPLKVKNIKQDAAGKTPGPTPEEAAAQLAMQEAAKPKAEEKPVADKKPADKQAAPVAPEQAQQVAKAIEDWAEAWRTQKADAYIAAYADFFRPEDGQSHKEWATQRRDRVTGPNYIRVNIANLRIRLKGQGRAVATFQQDYQSDSYQDSVKKSLYLENIRDKWLIVREVSE